ncbi:energy transducer TonB family protein [Pedobacter cryophilus]|uniref:TonB family protein n=1 Tax=Pedobacter cryophilus TaxID=2571271 RepID=A0A4U1C967_9SPHI|nr:energy transducer TonB [Pedobacter cryophilus]TKC00957.1 TonB family protein [Pedobacter cryophilus]
MIIIYIKIWIIAFANLLQTDDPTYKGGTTALNNFISSNLIYPSFSKNNCIQGTIYVAFQVDKNGVVFNSKVQKGLGVDLDDEALRLVRITSNKWIIPTNHNINTRLVIPVNFSLKNYNCNERSSDQINKAIALYQSRLALEKAVINYYKNKAEGKANEQNEAEIIVLKSELGFDDKFISQKLKEAKQKIKQGDKEGACESLYFVKYIGSTAADLLIAENCK